MDNMKISANQAHRISQSQSGAKERDEGFIASHASAHESKSERATVAKQSNSVHNERDVAADRARNLIEQRKRSEAQQLSEKDKASEQQQKNDELSAQRQMESRAAANREKIKGSYDSVSRTDKNIEEKSTNNVPKEGRNRNNEDKPDPINLVV